MDDLPILQRRRIEAEVIKPIYDEMVAAVGAAAARAILERAITRHAIAHGARLAESQDRPNDLDGFAALLPQWQADDALRIDVVTQSETEFTFNVTRCRYAEMYREMGLEDLGAILSCNRDGVFCRGYNPDIAFSRSQTILGGASHCDFRYRLEARSPHSADDAADDASDDASDDAADDASDRPADG